MHIVVEKCVGLRMKQQKAAFEEAATLTNRSKALLSVMDEKGRTVADLVEELQQRKATKSRLT